MFRRDLLGAWVFFTSLLWFNSQSRDFHKWRIADIYFDRISLFHSPTCLSLLGQRYTKHKLQAEKKRTLHKYEKSRGMTGGLFILYPAWRRLSGNTRIKVLHAAFYLPRRANYAPEMVPASRGYEIAKSRISKYICSRLFRPDFISAHFITLGYNGFCDF